AHIPRPPNAFILFRSSFIRAGAVPANVEPSHASLSTIAGLTWAALPAPEKEHWYKKAKEERERHRERFPGYAFRP
ncbi:high mobility group box domain-containing protein, partial [Mycena capillaripes]